MRFVTASRPVVKRRRHHATTPFDLMVNDFFKSTLNTTPGKHRFRNSAKVNVLETDDAFTIEMLAPGLTKEHIAISIDNDVLTIEGKKETGTSEGTKYLRREFNALNFKRQFTLTDAIDQNSVNAAFNNGILSITLAKKEEAKPQPARQIEIA